MRLCPQRSGIMVFFDLLKTFIFLVSSVLLYPVLILLSASAVYIIWSAGRFLGEWMERARCGGFDPAKDSPQEFRFPFPVRRYREMLKHLDLHDDAAVAYLMRQAVAERQGALEKYKILIRLAPALGLLGTLIPMGTALASVGNGEINLVSAELVVAFTTTVVGLAVGSIAFLIHSVKRRWAASDIRQIEYITEVMTR